MLRRLDAERSFAALILDMDGLMLDTEVVEFRAWQRAAEDFGWSISAEQYAQLLGRTARDGWAVMTAWWEQRPASRGSLTAIQDRAADYAAAETVAVKKGLFALLDWVQRERVPVAVASSSPHATVTARLREA